MTLRMGSISNLKKKEPGNEASEYHTCFEDFWPPSSDISFGRVLDAV
ncbi:hypothetical protein [Massilia alkalitolerans]|jgi:hypothetical protein|nr:hypothetical protein [Massilia alkalitolerans]